MGMFSKVFVEVELPGKAPPNFDFQSKSTPDVWSKYTITKEGRLVEEEGMLQAEDPVPPKEIPFHGSFTFYTGTKNEWFEYEAIFTHGVLESIARINHEPSSKKTYEFEREKEYVYLLIQKSPQGEGWATDSVLGAYKNKISAEESLKEVINADTARFYIVKVEVVWCLREYLKR